MGNGFQGLLILVVVAQFVVLLRLGLWQPVTDCDSVRARQDHQRGVEQLKYAMRARSQQESNDGVVAAAEAQVQTLTAQVLELQRLLAQAQVDQQTAMAKQPPRMHPTLERMKLPSDAEDWSLRPKKAPTFEELYSQLYFQQFKEEESVFMTFPNPYNLTAHMDYPHSSLWLEGDKVMARVFKELGDHPMKFIVEAGSMHGGSAIRMAIELDKRNLRDVPILCIDPWSGDVNMWLNRVVWEHLNVHDGRATTFDQFMVNVREGIVSEAISPRHIVPFAASSIVGARWLQAVAFQPTLIYLDSAHELDETYYELCLYWHLLEPGGILMGDDYGWLAVRLDVDRFIKDYNLQLNMFGVYYNWFVRKPYDWKPFVQV